MDSSSHKITRLPVHLSEILGQGPSLMSTYHIQDHQRPLHSAVLSTGQCCFWSRWSFRGLKAIHHCSSSLLGCTVCFFFQHIPQFYFTYAYRKQSNHKLETRKKDTTPKPSLLHAWILEDKINPKINYFQLIYWFYTWFMKLIWDLKASASCC